MNSILRLFLVALIGQCVTPASAAGPVPRILLREALQFENIGDSGRVPGTLRLLQQHLPDAEVTLWPWHLHERERLLLQRTFPKLRIVAGEVDEKGHASSPGLAQAWADANIFICPSKNAATYRAWAATGRPYGLFGAAFDPISDRRTRADGDTLDELRTAIERLPADSFDRKFGSRALYEQAAFIFCRDTLSLRYLRAQQLKTSVLEFGPEGAFAIGVRDDARAERWLRRVGVEDGGFICVIPRLRYTPYYRVNDLPREESDYALDAINAQHAERDHAPLRELITLWVRQTGRKVILCPEMTYEIDVARQHLLDPMPDDVKKNVILRDSFWFADEACAVYARAVAVISAECHSPILALANGTPAFYVRNPVDTVKGEMFRDIGLGDWVFESGLTSGQELWKTLQPLHDDRAGARARVQAAMSKVTDLQRRMAQAIADAVAAHAK